MPPEALLPCFLRQGSCLRSIVADLLCMVMEAYAMPNCSRDSTRAYS